MNVVYNELPAPQTEAIAIDTEILGMDQGKLHRPTGSFGSLAISDGQTVWLILEEALVQPAQDAVAHLRWVMHHAAFDLFHLRRWAHIPPRTPDLLWDTMIWEAILWSGYYNDKSLEDLARRYLDVRLDKAVRKLFLKRTFLDDNMLHYAAEDAFYTYKVFEAQCAELARRPNAHKLRRLWNEVEGPMIEVVLAFGGMLVSKETWLRVAERYERERDEIKEQCNFNPNSPKQVKEALRDVGIRVISTHAQVLEKYSDHPLVDRVLRFRKAAKLANTYGRSFLEQHQEADGRIYSHYWTYGTVTGRKASSDPNLQNIPSDPIYRSSFVAAPGNKMIVADYSQQESRIVAAISGDRFLLDLFERDEDIHLMVARRVFGDDSIQKGDPRRFLGKSLNLGMTYGLSARRFAERVTAWYREQGIDVVYTEAEAQEKIDAYFRTCRGVAEYIKHYRFRREQQGFVTSRFGRVIWLNTYNRRWLNSVINAPIQAGAADQLKLVLVRLYDECYKRGWEFPVVAAVHDEIVAEVPEELVEPMQKLLHDTMIAVGEELYPEVKWKVGTGVGDSWACKE